MDNTEAVFPEVKRDILRDLEKRNEQGMLSYGKSLRTFDGRDSGQDAYEEALDLVVYLTKMRMERAELIDILRQAWSLLFGPTEEIAWNLPRLDRDVKVLLGDNMDEWR